MRLRNLTLAASLFAGSLQASIVYNGTSFGLAAGPNTILQDFSNPTTPTSATTQIAAANGSTTIFSNLTLSSDTSLYYDPNGGTAGSCGLGKSLTGVPGDTLPALTACVGNYLVTNGSVQNQQGIQPTLASTPTFLPDLDITFGSSVYSASFLFAVPSAGAGTTTFEVQLFNSSLQQVDTTFYFKGTLSSPAYLDIVENQSFKYVDITQLPNSGVGVSPVTGFGTTGYTFNAIIGDVQASTVAPEPGTIGLFGLGLAGLGYFARRRKA